MHTYGASIMYMQHSDSGVGCIDNLLNQEQLVVENNGHNMFRNNKKGVCNALMAGLEEIRTCTENNDQFLIYKLIIY